jgi:hypothetical protein
MKKLSFIFYLLFVTGNILYSQQLLMDEYLLLTLTESRTLDQKLNEIKQATGVDVCCYIARSLQNKSPEAFTVEKGNQMKIGTPGLNNALFIMIAPHEQQVFISKSYGIQWIISDQKVESYIDLMTPYFRDKKYADGILKALEQIEKSMTGYSWFVTRIDLKNTDLSRYIGKIVTFEYKSKSTKWKPRQPGQNDPEFDKNYKITLYNDSRVFAELFYSKSMFTMVNSILTSPSVKIFARVRKVHSNELELVGILP